MREAQGGMMLQWFAKVLLPMHQWKYRNPYNRTCQVCGRHEVRHRWAGDAHRLGWWEVFDNGDINKHKKGDDT